MKKIFLLGVAAASMVLATGVNANQDVIKEELDANIIVSLKGDISSLSEEAIIRQQNLTLRQIRSYITPQIEVVDRYSTLLNAINIKVNSSHVTAIRDLANVKSVDYNQVRAYQSVGDGAVAISNEITVDTLKENVSAATMNVPNGTKEGEGVLVAILDTGFFINGKVYDEKNNVIATNVTHNTFTKLDKSVSLHDNYESVNEKISKAKSFHGKPDADHPVYFNSKVPFYYDYGGETNVQGESGEEDHDVFTTVSEHGTHVASIAAGNDPLYKGIAPKAQLALMKVFTDYIPSEVDRIAGATPSTGAFDSNIIKALEDCAILGVDVINMSLGSALNDFAETAPARQAIDQLQARGVLLDIAAGNEGKNTFAGSTYEYWSTNMVETGILSTYSNSDGLIVAAAQADKEYYETAFVIGNKTISFRDQVENYTSADGEVTYNPERHLTDLLVDHPDGKFEWVKIGGWGETKDYDGKDVEGKIAIVDRGETTFVSKIQAATEAGAIAIGIIDNDASATDFTFRMDLSGWTPDIPVVSFLFRDKAYIDSATDHNALLLANTEAVNPTARTMTTFSSDGPTYDLKIKPEISSPGQSILGAVISDKDSYDYFNGTSMATPNVAGVSALILSENNTKEYRKTINNRLMSTADPMKDINGVNFDSVRRQGAGLIDVNGALNTQVYLDGAKSTELTGRAKIELFNNEDIKKGDVKLSFSAINEGEQNVTYTATTYIYRPALVHGDIERYPELEGKLFQATYNVLIGKVEQQVTLKPGYNLVTLDSYSIPASEKADIDANFEDGCYIEGFVTLNSPTQEDLSIPFLGFYGDVNAGEPVEPFDFEKDPTKTYPSDALNHVIHNWKGLQDADYASMWVAGYAASMDDISMEKVINNESSIDKFAGFYPVGINPRTGESTGKDIYVGNNGVTNTMIIQQFVARSVFDNVITITNKATGKTVLVDHMFDSFHGAFEDENEVAYQWPLFKSHANVDYWSQGYVASRAYTIIPLYSMDDDGNNLGSFPDGEYDMSFSYVLANGKTFEKKYTLHIDSSAPSVSSIERFEKDGENYCRVRFDELNMAYYVISGQYTDFQKDENGYYYDFKESDFEKGYGFINSVDMAYAQSKTLVKFDDPYGMAITNKSLNGTMTFSYTEKDNSATNKSFTVAFQTSGKQTVTGDLTITMKLPDGFNPDNLLVYSGSTKNEKRVAVEINDGIIRFTTNNSKTFRLDATEGNDTSVKLVGLEAFSCSRIILKGVEFDENFIIVNGIYDYAPNKEITSGYTVDISKVNTDVAGTYEVTVTYEGKTATVKIVVAEVDEDDEIVELEDTPDVVVDPNGTRDPFDPEPTPEPAKGGCGGSIIASSLVISIMSFSALALMLARKKKQD